QSLVSSGFRLVASFGPAVSAALTNQSAPQANYKPPAYPAVEIFTAGPATMAPPQPAVALPVSKTVLVNGGPHALLQLTRPRRPGACAARRDRGGQAASATRALGDHRLAPARRQRVRADRPDRVIYLHGYRKEPGR